MASTPHRLNAPGDFYVEDSCCLSCALPFSEAPGLFKWDGEGQCYIGKQPENSVELEQMLSALSVAEAACIRYRGKQRVIQIRLVQDGEGAQCDHLEDDLAKVHREMSKNRLTSEYGHARPSSASVASPSPFRRILTWLLGDA
jgi:hypothetical protein